MANIKGDIEIGFRAYSEAMRICNTNKEVCMRIGVAKQSLYSWRDGIVPGGMALAKLHHAGADVIYILTGKRSKMEG